MSTFIYNNILFSTWRRKLFPWVAVKVWTTITERHIFMSNKLIHYTLHMSKHFLYIKIRFKYTQYNTKLTGKFIACTYIAKCLVLIWRMHSADLINQFESVEANMFQHRSRILGNAYDATINVFLNEQSLHKSIKLLPPLTLWIRNSQLLIYLMVM